MPSYRILQAGVIVGLATVEAGAIVGRVHPSLVRHRDRLRLEIVRHAGGPFADLSCRFGMGGQSYLLVPAVPGEPPPLPARVRALTA